MSDPRLLGPEGMPLDLGKKEHASGFQLATDFSMTTGRGTVKLRIPGTEHAYVMLPAEARILGMQLVVESERAMCDAIFLRCVLEIFQVSPAQAVEILKSIGAGTRADHARVYEEMAKAAAQQRAMNKEGSDGTDSTH